jgi:hypothetical protein
VIALTARTIVLNSPLVLRVVRGAFESGRLGGRRFEIRNARFEI